MSWVANPDARGRHRPWFGTDVFPSAFNTPAVASGPPRPDTVTERGRRTEDLHLCHRSDLINRVHATTVSR